MRNCTNFRYSKHTRYSRIVKFGLNCEIGPKLWDSEFRIRVYINSKFQSGFGNSSEKRFLPFCFPFTSTCCRCDVSQEPKIRQRWTQVKNTRDGSKYFFLINKCFCLCSMCKNSVHMLTPEVENNWISASVNCVPAIDQCQWFMYR